MGKTSIQWTDHTVNPIRFGRGHYCQKLSPGCANCYASRLQPRFGNQEFGGTRSALPLIDNCDPPLGEGLSLDEGVPYLWLDDSKLDEVLRRRKPTKYFVCDMTDLFGEWVPDLWVDRVFGVMAYAHWHTFQVLTKRAARMERWFGGSHGGASGDGVHNLDRCLGAAFGIGPPRPAPPGGYQWPLPNVWLGVSVEDQVRADERIPHLLRVPAAVRFLSCEPLLGPVQLDISRWGSCYHEGYSGRDHEADHRECACHLDWVIVGGESGGRESVAGALVTICQSRGREGGMDS